MGVWNYAVDEIVDDGELLALRAEIKRLFADALDIDGRHVAEVDRRDHLHIAETDRRDHLHHAEIQRRDDLHEHELEHLRAAFESRDVIGQAKGILMATLGRSADQAFALIRQQSQHENRKVFDIATEIIERASKRSNRPAGDLPPR